MDENIYEGLDGGGGGKSGIHHIHFIFSQLFISLKFGVIH